MARRNIAITSVPVEDIELTRILLRDFLVQAIDVSTQGSSRYNLSLSTVGTIFGERQRLTREAFRERFQKEAQGELESKRLARALERSGCESTQQRARSRTENPQIVGSLHCRHPPRDSPCQPYRSRAASCPMRAQSLSVIRRTFDRNQSMRLTRSVLPCRRPTTAKEPTRLSAPRQSLGRTSKTQHRDGDLLSLWKRPVTARTSAFHDLRQTPVMWILHYRLRQISSTRNKYKP